MITLDGVRFAYDAAPVLDGVTFAVEAGESVALLGANGAGKTTILRLCMALLQPAGGRVVVDGKATTGLAPEDLAGGVGYLFQRPEDQLVRTTVRDEVAYGPTKLGWSGARLETAVIAALDRCGLTRHAAVHPYDLSLPRRRLVALASVLVTSPRVLLLDEPTSLLDRETRGLVAGIIRERVAAGTAVMAVVHDANFAVEAFDRGVAIGGGKVIADAPLEEMLRSGASGLRLPPAAAAVEQAGLTLRGLKLAELAATVAKRAVE